MYGVMLLRVYRHLLTYIMLLHVTPRHYTQHTYHRIRIAKGIMPTGATGKMVLGMLLLLQVLMDAIHPVVGIGYRDVYLVTWWSTDLWYTPDSYMLSMGIHILCYALAAVYTTTRVSTGTVESYACILCMVTCTSSLAAGIPLLGIQYTLCSCTASHADGTSRTTYYS
jgi:hypothetical protein